MILALLAFLAGADPVVAPSDAGTAIVLKAGQPAPEDGVFMPDNKALEVGKRLASSEAMVKMLLEQPQVSTAGIATAAGAVLSGIASVFGAGVCVGDPRHCGTTKP